MGHPALATAQRLTADNCYTLGHCFKVDGINAALPLHVAGINAKLNVGKLYQMVISIFTQQLLARNFDIKAFALKAGASHRVSIAQNGVGAIAVNVLVVGANPPNLHMVRPREIHDGNRKSTQRAGRCQCRRKAIHHFSNAPHTDQ